MQRREDLNERPVCAITGGTSGIGLATAQAFAEGNFHVSLCGRRALGIRLASEQIQSPPGCQVQTLQADVSHQNELIHFLDQTVETFSRIDVLVNNAAVAPLAPIEQLTDQQLDQIVDINIKAVFWATRHVWPIMKRQGGGVIINVSSLAAVDPFPGFSLYGASKAWGDLFTVAAAGEGKSEGIRVYSVRPGAVETPMLRSAFPDFPADQTLEPKAVAKTIFQLCQPELQYTSGQAIAVRK